MKALRPETLVSFTSPHGVTSPGTCIIQPQSRSGCGRTDKTLSHASQQNPIVIHNIRLADWTVWNGVHGGGGGGGGGDEDVNVVLIDDLKLQSWMLFVIM